ncbi:short-chain dehydrogenase [Paenibacillus baekrokdamisoli]|uniref:Short-chain dehydrogenase n=1 Tax=Paenibacillus baekrokdamisoli TaxID=1712516 RepID=A0A3G9JBG3_9BACL|nr:SDR family oxidoreductase [Paenibacillus baekrokdamisoli]MBB3072361.1 NAD(P)-dependent dehydrogenase (short-subunit alcohol dehydrogenase family) [Paenibacillus baekrokdamisoli]BBH23231.1 short-chain dehydrogenase [Paenibacillus baekrokdamisoli]
MYSHTSPFTSFHNLVGGAIGGAVARAFAREGAKVFLAGRTLTKLDAIASEISAAGGVAEIAQVDALDERAVEEHADAVVAKAGSIDIALNAIGIYHVQGTPISELSLEDYALPITVYTQTNFITAKAAARHMARKSSGVILTLSTPVSQMPGPGYMGHSVACAGVEAFSRHLAGELAPNGIRVICLRSHMIPEAEAMGSHTRNVFRSVAELNGVTNEELMAGAAAGTLLKRLPTLANVADTAVFMASEQAGAMTGTVANLTSGFILD